MTQYDDSGIYKDAPPDDKARRAYGYAKRAASHREALWMILHVGLTDNPAEADELIREGERLAEALTGKRRNPTRY